MNNVNVRVERADVDVDMNVLVARMDVWRDQKDVRWVCWRDICNVANDGCFFSHVSKSS